MAERAGVNRIEGKIESVELDPHGEHISRLILEDSQHIEGDLFIGARVLGRY